MSHNKKSIIAIPVVNVDSKALICVTRRYNGELISTEIPAALLLQDNLDNSEQERKAIICT